MGLHGRQNTLNAYVGIQYVCTCMRLHTVAGNEKNKKNNNLTVVFFFSPSHKNSGGTCSFPHSHL